MSGDATRLNANTKAAAHYASEAEHVHASRSQPDTRLQEFDLTKLTCLKLKFIDGPKRRDDHVRINRDGETAAPSKMFAGDDQRTIPLASDCAISCISRSISYITIISRRILTPSTTYG